MSPRWTPSVGATLHKDISSSKGGSVFARAENNVPTNTTDAGPDP